MVRAQCLALAQPHPEALCSGTKRRQGQLSVVDFSESPGQWFSDKVLQLERKYQVVIWR